MAQQFDFRLRIAGPGTSRVLTLRKGTTVIGRQTGVDLRLDHVQVSRQHAQLDCTETECRIADLESSNGTTVNGEKLTPKVPAVLAPGAVIRIGPFELTLEQTPVEAPKVERLAATKEGTPEAPAEPLQPVVGLEPEARPRRSTARPAAAARPPTPRPPEPPPPPEPTPAEESPVPPGLSTHSRRLVNYLPGIYHSEFMLRFLGIFESILTPIEWNVENFDLYLDPHTCPTGFLPWLANWFRISFDPTWNEVQRRTLLAEAHQIYARRGTRWALSRVLEIYTGHRPEIIDQGQDLDAFTFVVKLPLNKSDVNQDVMAAIIESSKPAQATYKLEFRR